MDWLKSFMYTEIPRMRTALFKSTKSIANVDPLSWIGPNCARQNDKNTQFFLLKRLLDFLTVALITAKYVR